MRLRWNQDTRRRDPDLTSLINVVFLILIFFIVAGTLRSFSSRDLKLAKVEPVMAGSAAPGRLIIRADGQMAYRGEPISLQDIAEKAAMDRELVGDRPFVIVADARLDAASMLQAVRALRGANFQSIAVMAEKTAQQ